MATPTRGFLRIGRFLKRASGGVLASLMAAGCASANGVVNLSHYDAMNPDFARMREEKIVGVIHEATYPREGDPRYAERAEAAARAGLLWGAYHFGNSDDPIRQADEFVQFVATHRPPGSGVLMVLDFEQNTHYPGGTMTVPQAIRFLEHVRARTGKYPGLYTNQNRVRDVLNHPSVDAASRKALQESWLWVANYHHTPESLAPWSSWMLWQYTGDGICDLPRASYPIRVANIAAAERNIFHGSDDALRSFWQEHAWRPGN